MALAVATGVPTRLIEELGDINSAQWALEDFTRRDAATSAETAAAKRQIDSSNRRRHQTIDAIDRHVVFREPAPASGTWYSETVGELCDRLVILHLKHTALDCSAEAEASRLLEVKLMRNHLAQVAAVLAEDIKARRAVLPPRTALKIYNSAVEVAVGSTSACPGGG